MTPLVERVVGRSFPIDRGDKDERGTLVLVGGPPECPGGVLLAAIAALRTGCGKVQLVVHPTVAAATATAMPEALVVGWDLEGPAPAAAAARIRRAAAVVVGPGLCDEPEDALDEVAELRGDGALVLDAGALPATERLARLPGLLVAPNIGEAASMCGEGDDHPPDPSALAVALAARLGRTTTVRGSVTVVADADGAAWDQAGSPCLATPGSGDVFMGVLGGLLARGVDPADAQAWAVLAHAGTGRLLERQRSFGWLAREIADTLPGAVAALQDG